MLHVSLAFEICTCKKYQSVNTEFSSLKFFFIPFKLRREHHQRGMKQTFFTHLVTHLMMKMSGKVCGLGR